MDTIALFGAAGKIGARIADKLKNDTEFRTLYLETGEVGLARLRERGFIVTSQEEAIHEADTIVLAIPDTLIGTVASETKWHGSCGKYLFGSRKSRCYIGWMTS